MRRDAGEFETGFRAVVHHHHGAGPRSSPFQGRYSTKSTAGVGVLRPAANFISALVSRLWCASPVRAESFGHKRPPSGPGSLLVLPPSPNAGESLYECGQVSLWRPGHWTGTWPREPVQHQSVQELPHARPAADHAAIVYPGPRTAAARAAARRESRPLTRAFTFRYFRPTTR